MPFLVRHRFLKRILGATAVLVVFSAGLVGFVVSRAARERLTNHLSKNLLVQGRLIGLQASADRIRKKDAGALDRWADVLGSEAGSRITVTAADGRVLGDSEVSLDRLKYVENHAKLPEIRAALAAGSGISVRRSETVGMDFLYAAVPIVDAGKNIGTVRLATPLTDVQREVQALQWKILVSSGFCLLAALFLSLYVSRAFYAPVAKLSAAAERISRGDYAAVVDTGSDDELGQFGGMLSALAGRVSETIAELSAEQRQLTAIFDNMVEGVALVGPKGNLRDMNMVMERLFGVAADEVKGRPFIEAVRQAPLEEIVRRTLADRIAHQDEFSLFTPDETVFEVHANPIFDGEELQGAVIVLHDITRLRRLEEVRKEFVANVSHELRTPLASVKGFAETLLRGGLEDKKNRTEFVETIERHADRLTGLVDDLLELASIESGKRTMRKETLRLRDAAEEIITSLEPLRKRRSISVENRIPADLAIRFDKAALTQVFQNLISNAIKYNCEKGRVEISARKEDKKTIISVKDTGMGIPSESLSRVFERFYRVDKARSREMGGTGPGLSIVKHLVESHDGRVWVESDEGAGSVFFFALPDA